MEICKQQSEIEMRHLAVISIYGYVGVDRFKRYGCGKLFFGSIDRY